MDRFSIEFLDGTNPEVVSAEKVQVQNSGALLFFDEDDNLLVLVAPGIWRSVVVVE